MKGTEVRSDGNRYFRLGAWIILVLAIPTLPFVGFGEALEQQFTGWLDAMLPSGTVAMLVIGLLLQHMGNRYRTPTVRTL